MHACDRKIEEEGLAIPPTPPPAPQPLLEEPALEPIVHPSRLRICAIVGPLIVLLFLWLWLFNAEGAFLGGPGGEAFEADFAMFVGAAQVLKDGGNPYDHNLLYRTERALLQRQGLRILKNKILVRVGNPPLLFWLMQPLARLPYQPVALAWMFGLYILSALGCLAALMYMRWSRRALPLAIFLLMPPVVMSAFYGNVASIVFAALCFSLAMMRRHPILAGVMLSFVWLKPQVALPIAGLILLFHPVRRDRVLDGFGFASVVIIIATVVTTGWASLGHWAHALTGYSRDLAYSPSIASLTGLYVRWTASSVRLGAELFVLASAVVLTAFWWWKHRDIPDTPSLEYAWLWLVWFLATPYAHFYDEMLLTIPILALLGRNGWRVTERLPAAALYLMFLSLLVISWAPARIQLLSLPVLIVAWLLYFATREPRYRLA